MNLGQNWKTKRFKEKKKHTKFREIIEFSKSYFLKIDRGSFGNTLRTFHIDLTFHLTIKSFLSLRFLFDLISWSFLSFSTTFLIVRRICTINIPLKIEFVMMNMTHILWLTEINPADIIKQRIFYLWSDNIILIGRHWNSCSHNKSLSTRFILLVVLFLFITPPTAIGLFFETSFLCFW